MDLAKITRLARKRYHQTIEESNIKDIVVPIACYCDERFYRQVCDDELTFFEHLVTLALFGEMAAKRGAIVVFVPIVPGDYFTWLKKFEFKNAPQTRARYVNWLMSGIIEGPGGQIDDGGQNV
jgi:hypothetical protein